MSDTPRQPLKPLVVGAPRSGFALLCSVVIHFVPFAPSKWDLKQRILNTFIDKLGDHISSEIVKSFASQGVSEDLLYNPNFRYMIGGPIWLSKTRPDFACFRKYIGVRGMGDFTLITSHPKEVLDAYEVVHSHSDPGLWAHHPDYADYTKYASIRNPVGILNSSVFSLNALASEYIQKFVADDNDLIRQQLALYKFTDLSFFEGLVKFLAKYLGEFVEHKDNYIVMKWEDLILNPVPTILSLAQAGKIPVTEDYAAQVWTKLNHINLTGHHKHNYRAGKGKVGDWKKSITNEHLRIIKDYGIEPFMIGLGYGPITDLDEREYTPFQKQVKDYIARGKIYEDFPDADLFNFAFNKSNLVSDKFPFKRYDWREWTQVERSSFTDEGVVQKVWDVAEEATGRINAFLLDFLKEEYIDERTVSQNLNRLHETHKEKLGKEEGPRYDAAFDAAGNLPVSATPEYGAEEPHLVQALAYYNIVCYRGLYYGLPHSLGEVDLKRNDVSDKPGVFKGASPEEVENKICVA